MYSPIEIAHKYDISILLKNQLFSMQQVSWVDYRKVLLMISVIWDEKY